MLFVVEYSALFPGSLRIRLFFQYRIKPPSPVDGNVAIDVESTEISRGDVILQFDGEWKYQNLFVIQNLTCFRNRFVQPPCKDIEKGNVRSLGRQHHRLNLFLELTLIVFREPTNERTAFRVTGREAYIYHHLQLWIRAEQTFGELNLTCTLISYTTPPRPTFPNPYAPSKISLFSVIFLTACVILIVGLSLVWLMNMYYRRYRHYREKKKLLEALARTTQEVLNKAPILTYNPNDPTLNYDDPTCAICLETFQAEDQLRQLSKIGQSAHRSKARMNFISSL